MSALKEQVAGTHYKELTIQPIELAYKVSGTPGFCKVAKYITRDKSSRKEDLEKALHCINLDEQLRTVVAPYVYSEDLEGYAYQMPTDTIEAIYICPYTVGEVPPIIKEFSDQFEDAEAINKILTGVYTGDYLGAKEALKGLAYE